MTFLATILQALIPLKLFHVRIAFRRGKTRAWKAFKSPSCKGPTASSASMPAKGEAYLGVHSKRH